MRAIMREESSFVPDIVSWAGAVGLMQLILPTAKDNAEGVEGKITRERLCDPRVNLPIAARFLATLGRNFDQHPLAVACAYNAGPGAARGWTSRHAGLDVGLFAEEIPYEEARNYSRRVTGSYGIYQWLYGAEPLRRHPRRVE
jgi:soluble lytic murein transglycosylase